MCFLEINGDLRCVINGMHLLGHPANVEGVKR